MSRILVTGINGFVGGHLARELHQNGIEVMGLGRDDKPRDDIADHLHSYVQADLTNKSDVQALPLQGVDAVINLAGLANVRDSFDNPDLYKQVNVGVLSTIGEVVLESGLDVRIIAVSTGAVYDSGQPLPQTEESRTRITSPYSESKLLMEAEAKRLREAGVDCVVARPFNHTGPGQRSGFLVPDLVQQLTENSNTITVGNLSTRRDYTDVRDIAHAYFLLATVPKLEHGLYNICSGASCSGVEALDMVMGAMNIDPSGVEIVVDKNLVRPDDPPELYGSHNLLSSETGWQPTIPLETTIKDVVASKS